MRTPLAWSNTFENKKRTMAATGGICFAIFLVFMQTGFLNAAKKNASFLFEILDFDLIIISNSYLSLPRSLYINQYRILQARSLPGVESSIGLLIEKGDWINPQNNSDRSCLVMGVKKGDQPFLIPEIMDKLSLTVTPNTMLVDRKSRKEYGTWKVGGKGVINSATLDIAGDFELGTGLISDGSTILSQATFFRAFPRWKTGTYNMGLIKIAPGFQVNDVQETVRRELPKDVRVLTKEEIIKREQHYFVNVKPIGIMFQVGALVGFIIGSVILYQVLSTEIMNRMNEYATMKAMGFKDADIYKIGIQQGLIYSFLGFVPALILAFYLYKLVHLLAHMPIYMEVQAALFVLFLSLMMCAIAAILALRKIKKADPADLF
jgi:putative ABC transport system permease protein